MHLRLRLSWSWSFLRDFIIFINKNWSLSISGLPTPPRRARKKNNRDTKKTENGGCKEKPEARLLAALDVLIKDPVHELPLFALEASPVATAVSTLLFLSAAQFSSRLGFVFFFLIFIFNETHRHHHRCSCSRHHRHRRPPPMRQRR